jgi:2-polyprenyl-3-methyl-5-hydroxy-6-metoxy-1,4-benzoquinol methylase
MRLSSSAKKSLHFVDEVVSTYESSDISRVIAPDDDMTHSWDNEQEYAHYFDIGLQALEIMLQAMFLAETTSVKTVLDMPCGFGRVARHLRTAFPQARLTCCDLYQDRVDFCSREFRADGVKSKENYDDIEFPHTFDLIWVGSLLTHMTEPLAPMESRSSRRKGVTRRSFKRICGSSSTTIGFLRSRPDFERRGSVLSTTMPRSSFLSRKPMG